MVEDSSEVQTNPMRLNVAMSRLIAAIMIVPALPLIFICVLLVRLTSRGPGIYSQERVGLNGKVFTMYKIRSMRIDAEANGPTWAGVGADPRVTRIGYWLRKLHLDELPQLFNVLKGEMALVGPRPERPEFVDVLAEHIPGYKSRLTVLPGVTGLAQINLPPDTDLDSVRRKLELDRLYIQTQSAWLDLRIIGATSLRVLGLRGGRAVALLGLQREPKLVVNATDMRTGPTNIDLISNDIQATAPSKVDHAESDDLAYENASANS